MTYAVIITRAVFSRVQDMVVANISRVRRYRSSNLTPNNCDCWFHKRQGSNEIKGEMAGMCWSLKGSRKAIRESPVS